MRATSCEPTLKKGFQIVGGRQGSLPGHLHALENHQQSDLRLQHRAHDGRTDGPGASLELTLQGLEPTEGARHPSQIARAQRQEQHHMPQGGCGAPRLNSGFCAAGVRFLGVSALFPRCRKLTGQEGAQTAGRWQTELTRRRFLPGAAHSPLSRFSLGFHFHLS